MSKCIKASFAIFNLGVVLLMVSGCSRFGPCDIASAIRQAAETGESVACDSERITVEKESPGAITSGADDGRVPEVYRIAIEGEQ